jgi:predicted permease
MTNADATGALGNYPSLLPTDSLMLFSSSGMNIGSAVLLHSMPLATSTASSHGRANRLYWSDYGLLQPPSSWQPGNPAT